MLYGQKTQVAVSSDADDYRDVTVRINLDGKTDWLFTVSLDMEFDYILEDATLRFGDGCRGVHRKRPGAA